MVKANFFCADLCLSTEGVLLASAHEEEALAAAGVAPEDVPKYVRIETSRATQRHSKRIL